MYSIRKLEFIRFKDETHSVSVIRAEIFCDTASDLPAVDAPNEGELDMGSIAYVIATGDMYVLNSSGDWKNSNGSVSDGAKNLTLNSPGKGQKYDIEQPDEKELEILETKEEGGEEDDELIRDPEGE